MRAPAQRPRQRRPAGERLRAQEDELPARQRSRAPARPRGSARRSPGRHSSTTSCRLRPGRKSSRSTPGRDHAVVAGQPLGRGLRGRARRSRRARRSGRAAARAAPCPAGSRAARARGRSRPRRRARRAAPGTRGSAGPGSKPCTTSYSPRASASERLARTPTGTPIRLRRETGTAGPSAISSCAAAVEQRAAAGDQVGRARRRREHGDVVAEAAQLLRDPGHVLVDVVRPRPGERRDQTDAQAHVRRV